MPLIRRHQNTLFCIRRHPASRNEQRRQNGGYTCACSTQTDYASYPAGPLAPCRPGEFYLRELPPLRAVLDDLSGVAGLLVVDGYTDLDPGGPARPGRTCARRVRHPGHRGGQVQVPRGYPRGTGPAQILGTPLVRHLLRDARSRRGGPGPAHGRPYGRPDALRRADTLARTGPPAATLTGRQPD